VKINERLYNFIKYFFIFTIYLGIIFKGQGYTIFLFVLLSFAVLNDEYRKRVIKNIRSDILAKRMFTLSVSASILVAGIIKYFIGTDVYLYICLINLMFYDKESLPTMLLGFQCFCFLVPDAVNYLISKNESFDWTAFGYDLIYYFAGLFIIILIIEQVKQKEKFEALSSELQLKNELLKEQQGLKEQLALSRERETVAQELHDSIGHTLVAVKMHVKVLEKYVGIDTEKEKQILKILNEILQDSIAQLRETVYRLKNSSQNWSLKEAIEKLIDNLVKSESMEIHFDFDTKVEEIKMSFKEVIYKSIRECITNSIKYAKANNLWISVKVFEREVNFCVKDDGIGTSGIKKSFGIQGIEERLQSINGSCTFKSDIGQGFSFEARINIEKEKVE
jgi:signal transduction histidine kinase